MRVFNAKAVRWEHGWEIYVDGVGVTQVRTLEKAKRQASDLIETVTDEDPATFTVDLHVDLGGLEEDVAGARHLTQQAAEAQIHAAELSRKVARNLRAEGLSVSDAAYMLGVTRGRVSQLTR
jgi:hypothetical protein